MKIFQYLFITILLAFLVACSSDKQEVTTKESAKANETTEEAKEEKDESISVDKGLLNVELKLPASMFEGQDVDTVIAEAEKEGIKATKNTDGSVTYKMSKGKHKEMMKEMQVSVIESVEEMKTSGDYSSIKDITYNKSFSEFTMVVDKAAYENSMDGFASLGLGIAGMMYGVYNGVEESNNKVTIYLKDEATQEVFDEVVYPDDMGSEE